MGWFEFIAAFVTFFATHRVPTMPPVRAALVARLGAKRFGMIYGIVSLCALVWLIGAAGRAPYVELWPQADWMRWLALGAMGVSCVMIALSAGRASPFSFGGGDDARFDPAQPGLERWMRHPLLWAIWRMFWSLERSLSLRWGVKSWLIDANVATWARTGTD